MRRAAMALVVGAILLLALPSLAGAAQLIDIGDFDQPLFVAAPPGDASRLMVVEKPGSIRVLQNGVKSEFLNVAAAIPGGIEDSGEQGLLSMAFAPDYASSGHFYVYYTAGDGNSNRVDRFTVSADRSVADPASRQPIIQIPHTGADNHNGGQIAFGPDGFLYLGPGDGGTSSNAQTTANLLGKVLRIDAATGAPAPGNPFGNEVYHLGLRNPYRFSFDRGTGDLIIGDVGGTQREEVTLIPVGTPAGRNLGWPICEGSCGGSPPADYWGPALQYDHLPGQTAVTGGVVVRDPSVPELFGRYLYADFYEGVIRSTSLTSQAAAGDGPPTGLSASGVASFSEDNGDCVYVTALMSGDVYRLAADGAPAPVPCGSPPAASPADTSGPRLRTRVKRRQRVLRLGGAVAYARCPDEPCTVSMTASLRIGPLSYPLRRAQKALAANRRGRLRARLTRRARRALRRALRRGKHPRVDVALRARDGAGNRSAARRAQLRVRR
jgi:glucose/arabinose dehydrogenase